MPLRLLDFTALPKQRFGGTLVTMPPRPGFQNTPSIRRLANRAVARNSSKLPALGKARQTTAFPELVLASLTKLLGINKVQSTQLQLSMCLREVFLSLIPLNYMNTDLEFLSILTYDLQHASFSKIPFCWRFMLLKRSTIILLYLSTPCTSSAPLSQIYLL